MDPNLLQTSVALSHLYVGSNRGTLTFYSFEPYRPKICLRPWYISWFEERYDVIMTIDLFGSNQVYITNTQPGTPPLVSIKIGDRMVQLSRSFTVSDILSWSTPDSNAHIGRVKIQRQAVPLINLFGWQKESSDRLRESIYDSFEGFDLSDRSIEGPIEELKQLDLSYF